VRLYQFWRSSASWRVRWALAIKGIPFESQWVDLFAREQRDDPHRVRNPIGHVPVLEVEGRFLGESMAILEWLEETRPTPALFPADPWGRARVRQLCELVNAGIQPLQNLAVLDHVAAEGPARQAFAAHWNRRGLTALEGLLQRWEAERPTAFCWGDGLTAADLFLVPQVYNARRFGVDVSPFPRVLAAEAAALATPHARGAVPEQQPSAPAHG
jgi:maleylacetoacetate isomerase